MSLAGHFALRRLYISGDGVGNRRDKCTARLVQASILSETRFLAISEVHVFTGSSGVLYVRRAAHDANRLGRKRACGLDWWSYVDAT